MLLPVINAHPFWLLPQVLAADLARQTTESQRYAVVGCAALLGGLCFDRVRMGSPIERNPHSGIMWLTC
jgi:hypothetical protein